VEEREEEEEEGGSAERDEEEEEEVEGKEEVGGLVDAAAAAAVASDSVCGEGRNGGDKAETVAPSGKGGEEGEPIVEQPGEERGRSGDDGKGKEDKEDKEDTEEGRGCSCGDRVGSTPAPRSPAEPKLFL